MHYFAEMKGNNLYPRADLCPPPHRSSRESAIMRFILTDVFTVMLSLLQNPKQLQILLNAAPDSVVFAQTLHSAAAVPNEQPNTVADVNRDT